MDTDWFKSRIFAPFQKALLMETFSQPLKVPNHRWGRLVKVPGNKLLIMLASFR